MPFEIVRNDITAMQVDAIVNTANPRPVVGTGVDHAVHEKAGPELLQARREIGKIPRGGAAVTPGFGLPCRYVIHAVSPWWEDGQQGEEALLRQTYDSALSLAAKLGCRSAAFPLLAAGNYGFPHDRALSVAMQAFSDFLLREEMQIYLVVFDEGAYALCRRLLGDVRSYVDDHYVLSASQRERRGHPPEEVRRRHRQRLREEPCPVPPAAGPEESPSEETLYSVPEPEKESPSPEPEVSGLTLAQRLALGGESFTEALLRIIGERGWTEPEVYKRVFMDHRTFNKIRNNPAHQPSRRTALQLSVALRLSLEETQSFIGRAGYALTDASSFDTVISYFLEHGDYDIGNIDMALFDITGKTLSGCCL